MDPPRRRRSEPSSALRVSSMRLPFAGLSAALRYHSNVSNSSFAILSNPVPLDHERFSAHRELESLLKKSLRGPDSSSHAASDLFRFDLGSRALYAADASNYRQLPIGVVFPRDAADVEIVLTACRAT